MNNCNLTGADRLTHIKIVVVSLVAATIVVGVGIAARTTAPNSAKRIETSAAMFKTGTPAIWGVSDGVSAR
jgi:hypothetical protein